MRESKRLASLVADELGTKSDVIPKAVALDPATIAVLASILIGLVKMAIECSASDAKAAAWLKNPGIIGRLRLRWLVNRELKGDLAKHTTAVRTAILSRLAGEDSGALIAEVRSSQSPLRGSSPS